MFTPPNIYFFKEINNKQVEANQNDETPELHVKRDYFILWNKRIHAPFHIARSPVRHI